MRHGDAAREYRLHELQTHAQALERSTLRVVSGGLNNSQTSSSQTARIEPDIVRGVLAAQAAAVGTTRICLFELRRIFSIVLGICRANPAPEPAHGATDIWYVSSHHEDSYPSKSGRTNHRTPAAFTRLDASRFCAASSACRLEYQPEQRCKNGGAACACRRPRDLLFAQGLAR